MSISSSDLYVVVTYISYSGISGDLDTLFTDRKEAEAEAERASSVRLGSTSLKYSAMSLSDYIDELRSESYHQGCADERDTF